MRPTLGLLAYASVRFASLKCLWCAILLCVAYARLCRARYAAEHQLAVVDCLEDPDDTLKKKTLELLFKMTKPNNVEVRRARVQGCRPARALSGAELPPCKHHHEPTRMRSCHGAIGRLRDLTSSRHELYAIHEGAVRLVGLRCLVGSANSDLGLLSARATTLFASIRGFALLMNSWR